MALLHFTTWPLDLGDPKEKFHVKPEFKFTKMNLTGPERKLLEKCGTRFEAFQKDVRVTSSGEEYKHFIQVLKAFEATSVSSSEGFRRFVKVWEANGNRISRKERVWLKYLVMLKEEKELKKRHEYESISSPERDEYIKSRLVP
jgi:uncharacterized protein YifE (UPF0438 family)